MLFVLTLILKLTTLDISWKFHFNKSIEFIDLPSLDCEDSKFCYQPAGHIVTGNLKIITDSVQLFQKDLSIDSKPTLTSINVEKQLPVL